jgi:hypothetical protein
MAANDTEKNCGALNAELLKSQACGKARLSRDGCASALTAEPKGRLRAALIALLLLNVCRQFADSSQQLYRLTYDIDVHVRSGALRQHQEVKIKRHGTVSSDTSAQRDPTPEPEPEPV